MAIHKTSAIILKAVPYKEHDKLLTCFTIDKGRLLVLSKRSRHTTNRWASSFEPPLLCNMQLYEKNQYYTVTEISIVDSFLSTGRTLKNMLALQCIGFIIDRFTATELEHQSLFYLLLSVLRIVNRSKNAGQFITSYFSLQFLKEAGFALNFDECRICQHSFTQGIFSFSATASGFLCDKCTRDRKIYPYFPISLLSQIEKLYYMSLNDLKEKQIANCLFNYSEIDRIMKELYKGFLSKECLTISQFKNFS